MSQKYSYKGPVSFHDVVACFSEEEWNLLHQWQEELYKNVMQEIHQAVVSLGPLIAASVFSLRTNEKEELCPKENQENYEEIRGISHSLSATNANYEVLFEMNQEENQNIKDRQHTDRRERQYCLGTGFPVLNSETVLRTEPEPETIVTDPPCTEGGNGSTPHMAEDEAIMPIISFIIKEEGEPCPMAYQDSEKSEHISSRTGLPSLSNEMEASFMEHIDAEGGESSASFSLGYRAMKRRRKDKETLTCTKQSLQSTASFANTKGKILQSSKKGTHSLRHIWSESHQELREEATIPCESELINDVYSNSPQGTLKAENFDTYNKCESAVNTVNLVTFPQITLPNWGQGISTESEHNVSNPKCVLKHQRSGRGARLYPCNVCKKSFNRKHNLLRHQTIHVGEKPYQCTECGKSFSRKDNLITHHRVHMGGVRPL